LRLGQQGFPGAGQCHPPAAAVEQQHAERRLQLGDALGERRLTHVQLPRRPPEVEGIGDHHEVAQVTEVHLLDAKTEWIGPHTVLDCAFPYP
jgi:hypothetical protein